MHYLLNCPLYNLLMNTTLSTIQNHVNIGLVETNIQLLPKIELLCLL